ncbi:MAG: hypothetical protein NTV43_11195 [Methylococcales bacterium]|nr:hypothetical protein [Methylococcales bacterium]
MPIARHSLLHKQLCNCLNGQKSINAAAGQDPHPRLGFLRTSGQLLRGKFNQLVDVISPVAD